MNTQLQPIEYSNQRILTTQQIAAAYGTDTNNINVNFHNNKDHFVSGEDYFVLEGETLKTFKGSLKKLGNLEGDDVGISDVIDKILVPPIDINALKYSPSAFLWTEMGAMLHAKSLNTDQAWDMFKRLRKFYFQRRHETPSQGDSLVEQLLTMSNADFRLFMRRFRRMRGEVNPSEPNRLPPAIGLKPVGETLEDAILRHVKRLGRASVADIRNREKQYSVAEIEAVCENHVQLGILVKEPTIHTWKYTLKMPRN